MKLYFPEITFSAAHYIPGHKKCGGIHGHTYYVRDLTIELPVNDTLDEMGMSIDFGRIKEYFKQSWDHKLILPNDIEGLRTIFDGFKLAGITIFNIIHLPNTTAEGMALVMRDRIASILGWRYDCKYNQDFIHFKLFEGPNQAVEV